MKKIVLLTFAVISLVFASCQKTITDNAKGNGYLSFSGLSLGLDEDVITKAASAAPENYVIYVMNADGDVVYTADYGSAVSKGNKISVPAGTYTFVARSQAGDIPMAEFNEPIYGVEKQFTVAAGQTTTVGELVCTLLQCKVTVSYSDEFLEAVTGEGVTTVTVTAGHPLDFNLNADKTYEEEAGYFAVNGTTMEVVFQGSVDNKIQKMTKTFTGIAPKQWHKIKFVQKKNEQGQATFEIVINDLIDDDTLNNDLPASEVIVGEDPDAPKGDGGITLAFDYEGGCDEQLTDLNNLEIVPVETRKMNIILKATIPGAVKKFTVNISSDNPDFLGAVDLAQARNLDLINPKPENADIFKVVPFPHGEELYGETEVAFDLSPAQEAILLFPGTHTFKMTIQDQNGCINSIPVTMIVK
jgi:hypothetical protein